ncbi:hypothetical protein L2E82_27912 [Cichorium intybus]|uniref:Uncharacterized protein n=1 Tax=Cichorium intybus TaxID=13427 RepID=A0ACB9CUD7_CICIN|nr:hypothetical protein L2E82_27912 [Cichorium intybus]
MYFIYTSTISGVCSQTLSISKIEISDFGLAKLVGRANDDEASVTRVVGTYVPQGCTSVPSITDSEKLPLNTLVELLDSPLHNYFKQKDCLKCFFCFHWILIQFKRQLGPFDSRFRSMACFARN